MILIGNFAQLPPVGESPLFSPEGAGSHGHTVYKLFTKVVILDKVIRQSGTSTESKKFREILMRLRDGKSTEHDWQNLLQRTSTEADNVSKFTDATRLYSKKDVAQYNYEATRDTNCTNKCSTFMSSGRSN